MLQGIDQEALFTQGCWLCSALPFRQQHGLGWRCLGLFKLLDMKLLTSL
jgi:hypothetical protein